MIFKWVFLPVIFVSSLVGCSSMSSTVDGKTHIFNGKQKCPALLEMDVGQILEYSVEENPSTGYVWILANAPKFFKVEELYQTDKVDTKRPLVGVGGQKTFRFIAEKAGEERIHVKHIRTWESTSLDEWSCRIRIS